MPPPIRREGNWRHKLWGRSGTTRLQTAGDGPWGPSTQESDRGTSRRGDGAPSTGRPAARSRSLAREGRGWAPGRPPGDLRSQSRQAARPVRPRERQAQTCHHSPQPREPQDSPSEMPASSPSVNPDLNKHAPNLPIGLGRASRAAPPRWRKVGAARSLKDRVPRSIQSQFLFTQSLGSTRHGQGDCVAGERTGSGRKKTLWAPSGGIMAL